MTPEGIRGEGPVRARGPGGPRISRYLSRDRTVPARPLPDHVRHPALDDPAIRWFLHGRGFERVLPAQPRGRPEGPVGCLRSRDPPRLRFRPPPRLGRCRHGGRRHRLDLRHAHPVLRHPPRRDDGVDDHERRGAADPRALHRRGGGAGRAAAKTRRHHPERHPQGVHGPQHLHLSPEGIDADHLGHFFVYFEEHAEIQFHFHFRLPHAGGRRDERPGAGLHAGRRRRVHQGRARPPA